MSFVENAFYHVVGIRKEFPELNPIAAVLMKAGANRHVAKNHCIIEGYPLPQAGAAILTGNHYSSKDPLIACYAGLSMAHRLTRTVAKKSLVVRGAYESAEYLESIGDKSEAADYSRLEAFIMRGVGVIPILRDDPQSNIAMIRQCYQILDTGQLLGVFLQASRDEEGLLRNLQIGAARIASRPKYRDIPIHAFAFSKDKTTLVEPFTYNQLKKELERDIDVPEFTIIIVDRIAVHLPKEVQEDWKTRREVEFARLRAA